MPLFDGEKLLTQLKEEKATTLDLSEYKVSEEKGKYVEERCFTVVTNGQLRRVKPFSGNRMAAFRARSNHYGDITDAEFIVWDMAGVVTSFLNDKSLENYIDKYQEVESKSNWLELQGGRIAFIRSGNSRTRRRKEAEVVDIWDIKQKTCTTTLAIAGHSISCFALLLDGRLVTGSEEGTVKIWDIARNMCVATLNGHSKEVLCLTVSEKGILMSTSKDKSIKLWNTTLNTCITTLTCQDEVTEIVATSDENIVSRGARENFINFWDVKKEKIIGKYNAPYNFVALPNGKLALINSVPNSKKDYSPVGVIEIIDFMSQKCEYTLTNNLQREGSEKSSDSNTVYRGTLYNPYNCMVLSNGQIAAFLRTGIVFDVLSSKDPIMVWQLPTRALTLEDLRSFLTLLAGKSTLKSINFQNTALTDADVKELTTLLAAIYSLEEVDLRHTQISAQGVQEFNTLAKTWLKIQHESVHAVVMVEKSAELEKAKQEIAALQQQNQELQNKLKRLESKEETPSATSALNSEVTTFSGRTETPTLVYQTERKKHPLRLIDEKADNTTGELSVRVITDLQQQFELSLAAQQKALEEKLSGWIASAQHSGSVQSETDATILARLSEQEENASLQRVSLDNVKQELETLSQGNNQLQEEMAELREQAKTNSVAREKLEALKGQVAPLLEDYEERRIILQQQKQILESLPLKIFYQRVQLKLNQVFLAYMVISSGKVDRSGDNVNTAISLVGNALNLATFGAASLVMSGVNAFYNRKQNKKINKITDQFFVTITASETLSEHVARRLALRYEEQIKCLTLPSEEGVVAKLTAASGPNGGTQTLAECAVRRMLDAFTNLQQELDSSALEDVLVDRVFAATEKQGVIKNEKIATNDASKSWTDQGIFQRAGLKVVMPDTQQIQYFKGEKSQDYCNRPEKYGRRWGTLAEAQKLGLTTQKTAVEQLQSPAPLASPVHQNTLKFLIDEQKVVKAKQELQAELLLHEKERNEKRAAKTEQQMSAILTSQQEMMITLNSMMSFFAKSMPGSQQSNASAASQSSLIAAQGFMKQPSSLKLQENNSLSTENLPIKENLSANSL